MTEQDRLRPIAEGTVVQPTVQDIPENYGGNVPEDPDPAAPHHPNSFYLPLGRVPKSPGKRGHISWQSDNPIAVLALVLFVIDLFVFLVLCIFAFFKPPTPALDDAIKVLGQLRLQL